MKLSLEITEAIVVLDSLGSDHVTLVATLPSSMPRLSPQPLRLTFLAEAETGADYVREHFHLEPMVINSRK